MKPPSPTLKDRVAQMALKLVIEPIFETGFYQSSYAYRPGRRCHDAIAEIYHFAMHSYEWIVETDVEACFDQLPHGLITDEVRRRVVDKRVLALIRAFLKAGVMTETGRLQRTITGTPQGGIASPLLANIALSALDRQYEADWQQMSSYQGKRQDLRRKGLPTYRLCRYADDLVLMVMGTREQATALLGQLSGRVQALGLKLKAEKTAVTHIDEGFVFLGQRLIRRDYGHKCHVYTFVPNEALASIKHKVKALTGRSTTNLALSELIAALNPVLRGWTTYYQHVSAKRTFGYLDYYVWWRVGRWLRKKHPGLACESPGFERRFRARENGSPSRPARESLLGCQLGRGGSLIGGTSCAVGRSLPGMSLAFALMAAINGSTGSSARLTYGLKGTKPHRRQPDGARILIAQRRRRKPSETLTWKQINRRYLNDDYTYQEAGLVLYKPARTPITRYRYRGARIPTPWTPTTADPPRWHAKRANLEEQLTLEIVQQALA